MLLQSTQSDFRSGRREMSIKEKNKLMVKLERKCVTKFLETTIKNQEYKNTGVLRTNPIYFIAN
jgi:hypothetical protein